MSASRLQELLDRAGLDFDRLRVIVDISGVAVNEAPVRVGSPPKGVESTDMPLERLPDGTPYIPGSTVKGVLRSFAEGLKGGGCTPFVSGLKGDCALAAAVLRIIKEHEALGKPFQDGTNGQIKGLLNEFKETSDALRSELVGVGSREEVAELLVGKWGLPCPVCRLFGNTELAAHVHVYDVLHQGETPNPRIRHRVAIDRFRGAARSRALFDYEFVPAGFTWGFRVRLVNVDPAGDRPQDRLFRSLLEHLSTAGLSFGGMKSVGLGMLRLVPEETMVRVYEVRDLQLVPSREAKLEGVLEG